MILKLLAVGFRGYVMDSFNIFDALIVVTSILDIILSFFAQKLGSDVITAFRAFRLIRVFKLAKAWKRF